MSLRSNAVQKALYSQLNVSSVTNVALGGIHYLRATEQAANPVVVFNRQAAGNVEYAFDSTIIAEDDIWAIKVYSDEDSDATRSPQDLNEVILDLCMTAINGTLTPIGYENWWAERLNDIPEQVQLRGDKDEYMNGFLMRVVTS